MIATSSTPRSRPTLQAVRLPAFWASWTSPEQCLSTMATSCALRPRALVTATLSGRTLPPQTASPLSSNKVHTYAPLEKDGAYCFANTVNGSVCPSVRLSVDQLVSDHNLENYLSQSFHILMLIGLGEDKNPSDFGFTMSKVKVTRVTFVKKLMFSAHYLENYLSQCFHI